MTPVRKLIYSMGVSLDGFIAGPAGEIDWSAPGEELHRFHNEQAREAGAQLYGRRLYEDMLGWAKIEERPSPSPSQLEFSRIWRDTPKLVFSNTLGEVEQGFALQAGDAVETVERLKREPGKDLAVGGAGLAATFVRAGLVDEYRLFISPIVLGAGTPFFPALERPIELRLLQTRTFDSRVVYLRYGRAA
jgi:dihydrofolate reductase